MSAKTVLNSHWYLNITVFDVGTAECHFIIIFHHKKHYFWAYDRSTPRPWTEQALHVRPYFGIKVSLNKWISCMIEDICPYEKKVGPDFAKRTCCPYCIVQINVNKDYSSWNIRYHINKDYHEEHHIKTGFRLSDMFRLLYCQLRWVFSIYYANGSFARSFARYWFDRGRAHSSSLDASAEAAINYESDGRIESCRYHDVCKKDKDQETTVYQLESGILVVSCCTAFPGYIHISIDY